MSFPWKKSKMTSVSRLVSGLHKTPKRGGSLVVETGFPTSLIDLFVKNRDRLRRSSERKSDPTRSYHSPPRSAGNTDACESASTARETDDEDDEKKKRIELEDGEKMETELTSKQGTERTRSARIRSSLIKKFVPKKLRYRNEKNQGNSEKEKEKNVVEEETESGTESETELVIVPTTKFDQNDQNLVTQSAEKEKNLRNGNSGHVIPFVVLLLVVVLVGLIGGRCVALLLTLLCYSMMSICVRTRQINVDSDNNSKTK